MVRDYDNFKSLGASYWNGFLWNKKWYFEFAADATTAQDPLLCFSSFKKSFLLMKLLCRPCIHFSTLLLSNPVSCVNPRLHPSVPLLTLVWQLSSMSLNRAAGAAFSAMLPGSVKEYLVSMSNSKCWKRHGSELSHIWNSTHFMQTQHTYQHGVVGCGSVKRVSSVRVYVHDPHASLVGSCKKRFAI